MLLHLQAKVHRGCFTSSISTQQVKPQGSMYVATVGKVTNGLMRDC